MDDLASWSNDILKNLFGAIDQRFNMHNQIAKYNTDVGSYNSDLKKKKVLEDLKDKQFWDVSGKHSPFSSDPTGTGAKIDRMEGRGSWQMIGDTFRNGNLLKPFDKYDLRGA